MKNFVIIAQIVCAILLVIFVLLQVRGTGFGRGSTASFTRRGAERLIFKLTFVVTAIFLILSITNLFI
ncbi:preprotein translocase subunit SecG [Candidatus Microgenomates bacterium]|nr:preprotein translocase subunit SecG [Candidatus Microgenomates bacterium]